MPASLYGVAPISGSGAYGAVPGTPDPTSTATSAISGNIGNLANLYGLAQGAGTASAIGQQQQYIQNLPGYMANRNQQSTNIAQELAGQLPQDVVNQIAQQSAQIGAGSGMGPMSPLSNADYLKDIGLTSLGMQQAGGTALNQQIQTTPTGPAFNPASMMVTPQQEQEAALQASMMNAAPNPTAAAEANLLAQQQAAQAAQNAANLGGTAGNTGTGGYRVTGSQGATSINPAVGTGGNPAAAVGGGVYGATGIAGQTGLGGGTAGTWTPMGNGLQYNSQTGAVMPVGSGVLGGGTNTVDTNPYAGLGVGYDPTTGDFSAGGGLPPNSTYNPATDTVSNNYGIPNYYNMAQPSANNQMTDEDWQYLYNLFPELEPTGGG